MMISHSANGIEDEKVNNTSVFVYLGNNFTRFVKINGLEINNKQNKHYYVIRKNIFSFNPFNKEIIPYI